MADQRKLSQNVGFGKREYDVTNSAQQIPITSYATEWNPPLEHFLRAALGMMQAKIEKINTTVLRRPYIWEDKVQLHLNFTFVIRSLKAIALAGIVFRSSRHESALVCETYRYKKQKASIVLSTNTKATGSRYPQVTCHQLCATCFAFSAYGVQQRFPNQWAVKFFH